MDKIMEGINEVYYNTKKKKSLVWGSYYTFGYQIGRQIS